MHLTTDRRRNGDLSNALAELRETTRRLESMVSNHAQPSKRVVHIADLGRQLYRLMEDGSTLPGARYFANPGLCMILGVYAHAGPDRSVPMKVALSLAQARPTTALRYLVALERSGVVVRIPESNRKRRYRIALSDNTVGSIETWLLRHAKGIELNVVVDASAARRSSSVRDDQSHARL